MVKKIVLFVDCDNQSALRAKKFLCSVTEKIGSISCAFLVGNNHGESVAAWRREVVLHCDNALIDSIVVPCGKENADTELIGKMFAFKGLFSVSSAEVFIASRDSNIVAAGRMLESADFTVHYSVDRCSKKTDEVLIVRKNVLFNKEPLESFGAEFWLTHIEGSCKVFGAGKRRYSNLPDVGTVLSAAGLDRAGRVLVLRDICKKGAVVNKKDGRLYFPLKAG